MFSVFQLLTLKTQLVPPDSQMQREKEDKQFALTKLSGFRSVMIRCLFRFELFNYKLFGAHRTKEVD